MSKHFLSTKDLNPDIVDQLLSKANWLKSNKDSLADLGLLKGKILLNLFYESSTRTRLSFEIAAKLLGADFINFNPDLSSLAKGESFEDTAYTLSQLEIDLAIIRHSEGGAAQKLAYYLNQYNQEKNISVINAGDGISEHPTQALLDFYTIVSNCSNSSVKGKQIVIIGDCLHSRVARSNIYLLKSLGAKVKCIAPESMISAEFVEMGAELDHDLINGLKNADFIIVLRIQKERLKQEFNLDLETYKQDFCVTEEKLKKANLNLNFVKLLHPGPVNRNIEISENLINHPISLINQQVNNGVFIRMAVLWYLLGHK